MDESAESEQPDGWAEEERALLRLLSVLEPAQVRRAIRDHGCGVEAARALGQRLPPSPPALPDAVRLLGLSDLPPLLADIPDPPVLLASVGDVAVLHQPTVAIVGARRCTQTGAAFAERLARDLAAGGYTIVSGLALGIDAAAHRGALAAGCTAAVLACSVDAVYPRANARLAEEILQTGGCIVSEHLLHRQPRRHFFPERNRLISGVAGAVVVVEAGPRSGSLVTARLALEQGRDVMAVPGSIASPVSGGCHRLLRDGATLVESTEDVLRALGENALTVPPSPTATVAAELPGTPTSLHRSVFLILHGEPQMADDIVEQVGGDPSAVLATLAELEIAGFVHATPQGYIRRLH